MKIRLAFIVVLFWFAGAVSVALGQGWLPLVRATTIIFSLTATDIKSDTTGGTTVTYNGGGNPSVGTADSNRTVVVMIFARVNTTTISSVSICGVAAVQVSGAQAVNTNTTMTDIWQAPVSGGTTCTISVTYGASAARSAIAVYRLITGTPTATAATNNKSTSASTLSTTITIPAAGKGITSLGVRGNTASTAISWTGATLDEFVGPFTGSLFSSASITGTGSESPIGFPNLNPDELTMSTAAWGP